MKKMNESIVVPCDSSVLHVNDAPDPNKTTKNLEIVTRSRRIPFKNSDTEVNISQGDRDTDLLAAPSPFLIDVPNVASNPDLQNFNTTPSLRSAGKQNKKSRIPPEKLLRPLYKYIQNKKCLLCGFESKAKTDYAAKYHMVVHLKKKFFKCDVCNKRFTAERYMVKHRLWQHLEEPFPCDICGKRFRNKACVYNHRATKHSQKQSLKCGVCDKDFTNNRSLKAHLRIHTGEKPYACPICQETFRTTHFLKVHSQRKHGFYEPLRCLQCNLPFPSRSELDKHECVLGENWTQNPGANGPALSLGGTSSTSQSNADHSDSPDLSMTLPSAHTSNMASALTSSACENNLDVDGVADTYECDVPESNIGSPQKEVFENSFDIDMSDSLEESDEMSTSNAELIRPLYKYIKNKKCLLCGFESQAKDSSSAKSHLLVHITNKDFKCDICDKRFSTEKYMARHRLLHSDVFPFSCDLCDKKYRTKNRLRNHKQKIHEERRKWKCEVCHKDFTTNVSLKQHLRVHTGERPHVCPICKQAFRVKNILTNHLRRHYRCRNALRCPHCNVVFAGKSDLCNHECRPGSQNPASSASKSGALLSHSPSTNPTCLVNDFSSSASTSSVKNRNVGGGVDANMCNEPKSNVDSAEGRIESASAVEAFTSLGKLDKRCTINSKVIRPLYKYIKGKKCLLCGFESKAKEFFSVRSHLLVHVNNKDFKCDICDKSFSTEKYMLKHRVFHSDVFPFSCDLCDKKYRIQSSLYNHKKKVHEKRRKWKCEVCDKDFNTNVSRKEHLRLHT